MESNVTCEGCDGTLPREDAVWLELSSDTRLYHDVDDQPLPEQESMGWYPFHAECANAATTSA